MIEDISRRYFDNRVYSVVIIDVNSLFLFGGQYTIKYMYEFIDTLKKVINNDNAIIINVIDNGLNLKMLRDHPNYKANRITSVYNNTTTINCFSNRKSFKYKISQIHKIDSKFKNHLTFYLQGESDFKIGYIIQQIYKYTQYRKADILTISLDKDLILSILLSDVLLRKLYNGKKYQALFTNPISDIDRFKSIMKLETFNIKSIADFYYYLLVNGDSVDNIKQLLSPQKTINFLNDIYDKYDELSIVNICDNIRHVDNTITNIDVFNNSKQIDIFNIKTFTINQVHNMNYTLKNFFINNNINIKDT